MASINNNDIDNNYSLSFEKDSRGTEETLSTRPQRCAVHRPITCKIGNFILVLNQNLNITCFKMSVTPCRSRRSLHNEIPIISIITVTVIIRLLSKELYSLLEWNLTWGGGKVLLKPLLCMLSSITLTSRDPISFPIPLLSSLNVLQMHHLFSNFPLSYMYRTSD